MILSKSEEQKEKTKRKEKCLQYLWKSIKSNVHIIRVIEGEKREKEIESYLEK